MVRLLLIAGLLGMFAVPASAQMIAKKKMAMAAPSMEQCKMGYKASKMKPMSMSKSKFKRTCKMMMKPMKMAKPMSKPM